mmetsp:Transcript_39319/g.60076  ORF Transcript_39319/g.60076 Transcript_39319/m.60076 type:complete len:273 (-) Transcript_39319:2399-3217(-)
MNRFGLHVGVNQGVVNGRSLGLLLQCLLELKRVAVISEGLLELRCEVGEAPDAGVDLVHLLDSLLFPLLFLGDEFLELIFLRLVHSFKSFGEGLEQRVHGLGHLLVEVLDFRVDALHLLLGGLDSVSRLVEVFFVFLGLSLQGLDVALHLSFFVEVCLLLHVRLRRRSLLLGSRLSYLGGWLGSLGWLRSFLFSSYGGLRLLRSRGLESHRLRSYRLYWLRSSDLSRLRGWGLSWLRSYSLLSSNRLNWLLYHLLLLSWFLLRNSNLLERSN